MSETDLKPNETPETGSDPAGVADEGQRMAGEAPTTGASSPTEPEAQEVEPSEPSPAEPDADAKDLQIQGLADENQRLLYQIAEMQNIIRRTKAQAEQDRKFAAESLAESLLPVLDGFERTLAAAAKGASVESLGEGVRVIDKQMRRALEGVGVQRIVSLGAPFDPEKHEAVATVEDAGLDEETVVDEIEAGYIMAGRVIRHAKVRVSSKP
jgi:molecular chaperone GrpE